MEEPQLSAAEALAQLRENAVRLKSLTDGLAQARLHAVPEPGAWSSNDILANIRACCNVWGGNIAKILASDHPTFAGTSPRTWMKKTDYPKWTFDDAFRAFTEQRELLLATLAGLAPDQWERTASVTAYGQANERNLRSYASQLAKHERIHVIQMERALESN